MVSVYSFGNEKPLALLKKRLQVKRKVRKKRMLPMFGQIMMLHLHSRWYQEAPSKGADKRWESPVGA
jgi:hypothetical protein